MKEKKYLVLGIALVLLTFVGVSLAYFLTTIEGDRKNITINTADLRVIFTNGDAIEGTEIEPGWSVTKTFSVENKTKNEYKYNIVIEDLVNTFVTEGYLQYKITSTDGGYNMDDFKDVPKSEIERDIVLVYSVSMPSKSIQNYTITIQYRNDEEEDQSIDSLLDAVVTGNIYITKGTIEPTLAEAILRDNPTIEERTDFSTVFTDDTTGTIYQTNKTEDGSTVYYYSGTPTNNWVKFGRETTTECTYNGKSVMYAVLDDAKTSYMHVRPIRTSQECTSTDICVTGDYGPVVGLTEEQCAISYFYATWTTDKATAGNVVKNDIYWRIIRTNEDRSVRLLYSGTSPDTTMGYIGDSSFNQNSNDSMYVGYMYGTSGSLENNRTNTNDSAIKTFIDDWYENNLLNAYDKYISKTAIYCNDRSISSGTYSISSGFSYGASERVDYLKNPTYKCGGDGNGGLFESTQALADKFSVSTSGGGNGQLKYPIALITADEFSFAGGGNLSDNYDKPYIWYHINSQGELITDIDSWWSMSPMNNNYGATVWNETHSVVSDRRKDSSSVSYILNVRPSLSLSSCVKVSGTGTPDDPYEVDYDNSCK